MYSEWGVVPPEPGEGDGFNVYEICAVVGVVFGVLGLIGNGLLAAMMRTRDMEMLSSSVFVFGLALADIVVLVFEVADDVATLVPNVTEATLLHDGTSWRCRMGVFLYDWTRVVSSWLAVALSIELFMGHCFPKRRPHIFNHTRSFYVLMAICLIALAGCFPFLVISTNSERHTCSSKYRLFFDIYNDIVIGIVTCCLVPIVFIIVGNVRSALTLFETNVSTSSSTNVDNPVDAQGNPVDIKHETALSSFTLAITTVFALTTLPAGAVETVLVVRRHQPDVSLDPDVDIGLAYTVSKLLFLFNYAGKFYVGLFTSRQCRAALRKISSCGRIRQTFSYEEDSYRARAPSTYGIQVRGQRLPSIAEARF